VLIAPTKNRKLRLSFPRLLEISEPITAAWPAPIPGRNEQNGAASIAARDDFRKDFFFSFISFKGLIVCGGIVNLLFREIIRAEVPNKPVRSGRRGSLTGRLKVSRPKNPANVNTVREIRNSSSLKIR